MTSPVAQPEQGEPQTEEAILALVIFALLSGAPAATQTGTITSLLSRLGVPAEASTDALALALPHVSELERPEGSGAVSVQRRGEFARSARYIVNAAKRLATGGTVDAERRYLSQHIGARRARAEAAEQVADMAARVGPIVGWYSMRDSRVDPLCKVLDGTNFDARRPPLGLLPGAPHGGSCRCRAGRAHANGASSAAVLQAAIERRDIEFSARSQGQDW